MLDVLCWFGVSDPAPGICAYWNGTGYTRTEQQAATITFSGTPLMMYIVSKTRGQYAGTACGNSTDKYLTPTIETNLVNNSITWKLYSTFTLVVLGIK